MSFLQDAASGIVPGEIVRLGPERGADILNVEHLVWAGGESPEWGQTYLDSFDFPRSIGIDVPRSGQMDLAAIAGAWGFDTPVPGGRVNAAGLTSVGVRPGFRRRGFLRAMIARHFQDCRDRGEPLSMLFASEQPIYRRFGYGVGSYGVRLRLPKGAALRPVAHPGPSVEILFETASMQDHGALMDAVDRQAGYGLDRRTGWTMAPNAAERELRVSGDPAKKPSLEPWRIIIARRDGQPTGYALVRRDGKWEAGVPAGTATVREFRALDSASGQAIWRELVSLDLITSVVTPLLEIDDPLLTWLEDIRAAHPAFQDCEHVRIVGLPAALTARRYTVPLTVRIAVHDPLLVDNAGVWELDGGPDGAQVRRLSGPEYQAEADLSIGIDDLGSVYFGGVTATSLADAGVITEHTFGSVQLVSRAFRSDRAPAAGPGF